MIPLFEPDLADAEGLVAVGGDLRPPTLLQAYRLGVFPWYEEGLPVCWWSPDPRAIFELKDFHVSRRLERTMASGKFQVTINQAFGEVMRGCADREEGTWITRDMLTAYQRLHAMGMAHSVETWRDGLLVGGLYGVALGGFFAGESMFHRATDASKVALAFTVQRLRERGFLLFDTQMVTGHTLSLGAREIPRQEYLVRLRQGLAITARFC